LSGTSFLRLTKKDVRGKRISFSHLLDHIFPHGVGYILDAPHGAGIFLNSPAWCGDVSIYFIPFDLSKNRTLFDFGNVLRTLMQVRELVRKIKSYLKVLAQKKSPHTVRGCLINPQKDLRISFDDQGWL